MLLSPNTLGKKLFVDECLFVLAIIGDLALKYATHSLRRWQQRSTDPQVGF